MCRSIQRFIEKNACTIKKECMVLKPLEENSFHKNSPQSNNENRYANIVSMIMPTFVHNGNFQCFLQV